MAIDTVETISRKKARLGDIIEFTRRKRNYRGKVIMVRENSVMIQFLSILDHIELDYENNRTIVSHKNYKVVC
ncbi:DUF2187 family protein [Sutcliffiella cohnii]|uniref:DUF2187 family protein n=1 Tax=Sutcliffiella cohnii TaxID=33932 RepID=UPI000836FC72|nr:DUF2187 family protein [Sutcliffiella cohnii]